MTNVVPPGCGGHLCRYDSLRTEVSALDEEKETRGQAADKALGALQTTVTSELERAQAELRTEQAVPEHISAAAAGTGTVATTEPMKVWETDEVEMSDRLQWSQESDDISVQLRLPKLETTLGTVWNKHSLHIDCSHEHLAVYLSHVDARWTPITAPESFPVAPPKRLVGGAWRLYWGVSLAHRVLPSTMVWGIGTCRSIIHSEYYILIVFVCCMCVCIELMFPYAPVFDCAHLLHS